MPGAAAIAAQQGIGLPARLYSLRIEGLDVIAQPALSYGVAPESIIVVEAAAGDVSSMSFVIDDSTSQISVSPGQYVRFDDLGFDMPLFVGWVETYGVNDWGEGRQITVQCVGLETLLDWLYVPAFTIPAGTASTDVWQRLLAAAYGVGFPLNGSWNAFSTVAQPIGDSAAVTCPSPVAIPAGSLRQAGEAWLAAMAGFGNGYASLVRVSIDFWGGYRVWNHAVGTASPADYATIAVSTAADPRPSMTSYQVGNAQARQAAITQGANITLANDGSGIPGPFLAASNQNATTNDGRVVLGRALLAAQGPSYTGNTTIVQSRARLATTGVGSSAAQRRPGSVMTLTELNVGANLATIAQRITKTFVDSGEETWVIDFGGALRQYGTALIRKMTPGVFV